MYTPPPARRHHHKRISASRLSSDTTSPQLPEYWDRPRDPPPDYEADSSSVEMDRPSRSHSSPRGGTQSPRKKKHRNSASWNYGTGNNADTLLDSLLERSVHALEMSNSLLQTSMTTTPTLRRLNGRSYHSDDEQSEGEEELDLDWLQTTRQVGGSSTAELPQRERWLEDMDEISRTVDRLLTENGSHVRDGSSTSLPTSSPIQSLAHRRKKRRPSLDPIPAITAVSEPTTSLQELQSPPGETTSGHLTHAPQERQNLIAPPPRALTQYITHEEADALALPSTLGVRGNKLTSAPSSPNPGAPSTFDNSATTTTPKIEGLPPSSSSSAYSILSTLVAKPAPSTTTPPRSPFPSPPGTQRSSISSFISSTRGSPFSFSGSKGRRWSASSQSTVTSKSSAGTVSDQPRRRGSLDNSTRGSSYSPHRSTSGTPKTRSISPRRNELPQQHHRHHPEQTIPEESSLSSSSSSSDLHAEQTITSLRQILIAHPPPPPKETEIQTLLRTKRPKFTPRSAVGQAETCSSTATASVSKLFSRSSTGGKHTSTTRDRSPPERSSLKGGRRKKALASLSASASGSGSQTPLTQDGSSLSVPLTPSSSSSATTALASTLPLPPSPSLSSSRAQNISTSTRRLWSRGLSAAAASTPSLPLPWNHSTPSLPSGASTPASQKRISFAELPEGRRSHSTLRPGRRKRRSSVSSSKRKSTRKRRSSGSCSSSDDETVSTGGKGWLSWFIPPGPLSSPSSSSLHSTSAGNLHGSRAMMGSYRGAGEGLDVWSGL